MYWAKKWNSVIYKRPNLTTCKNKNSFHPQIRKMRNQLRVKDGIKKSETNRQPTPILSDKNEIFFFPFCFVLFVSYSSFISISPLLNSILFRKWIAFYSMRRKRNSQIANFLSFNEIKNGIMDAKRERKKIKYWPLGAFEAFVLGVIAAHDWMYKWN